jgi:hypothetical protein
VPPRLSRLHFEQDSLCRTQLELQSVLGKFTKSNGQPLLQFPACIIFAYPRTNPSSRSFPDYHKDSQKLGENQLGLFKGCSGLFQAKSLCQIGPPGQLSCSSLVLMSSHKHLSLHLLEINSTLLVILDFIAPLGNGQELKQQHELQGPAGQGLG